MLIPFLFRLEAEIKPSALDTVRDVIGAQKPYWSCLAVFSKRLPSDIDAFFALADMEKTDTAEDTKEVALNRSFRKMELVSGCGDVKN